MEERRETRCRTHFVTSFETRSESRCHGRCKPPVETRQARWDGWVRALGRNPGSQSWEVFVRRYGPWLHRRCWYSLARWDAEPRWDDVEELVQEVYCRLLENRRHRLINFRGDSEKALRTFLAKVVRTVVVNHMRYRRAARRYNDRSERDLLYSHRADKHLWEPPLDQVPCLSRSPECRAQAAQQRDQLRDGCRRNLGRRSWRRDADILCRALLDGWRSRDIAPEVCLSPSAVDSALGRARRRLEAAGFQLPERPGNER